MKPVRNTPNQHCGINQSFRNQKEGKTKPDVDTIPLGVKGRKRALQILKNFSLRSGHHNDHLSFN